MQVVFFFFYMWCCSCEEAYDHKPLFLTLAKQFFVPKHQIHFVLLAGVDFLVLWNDTGISDLPVISPDILCDILERKV